MLLMVIVATPILFVNFAEITQKADIWYIVGPRLALFGLFFEMIADYQLARFIKTKKPGEIFTS